MTQHILIWGALLLSALCGFIILPVIMNFCKERGLYDIPNSRKIHKNAIPRLGGISFLPSMTLAAIIVFLAHREFFLSHQISISLWSVCFILSLAIIYSVGIVDDLIGLGAKVKFAAQIIAALIMPFSGLYINDLYGFCGFHEIPFWVGAPLTVFIIVFVSNAINLIDGIDGLSAGLSLIALTGYLLSFMRDPAMVAYCILIAGLIGVLIPFLYFNIFGKAEDNRKIFMGDSGSLSLGFILGFLFVKHTMDNPNAFAERPDNAMMLSCTLLLVPVLDVVRVSLVRLKHHVPMFQADKNHIHHKLMRAGLNQYWALAVILSLALFFIALNTVVWLALKDLTVVIGVDVAVWLLFHWLLDRIIVRKGHLVYLPNTEKQAS